MSKLSRDDVLKLAALSRLKLTEEEIERLGGDISAILEYVALLDSVDVTGLEPTYQVTGLKNVTRDDEVTNYQATPEDIMALAPARQEANYKVKKVL